MWSQRYDIYYLYRSNLSLDLWAPVLTQQEEQVETGGAQLHYFFAGCHCFVSGMADSWNFRYFLKFCLEYAIQSTLTGQFLPPDWSNCSRRALYSSGKSAVIISGLLRLWRFPMCCFYWLLFLSTRWLCFTVNLFCLGCWAYLLLVLPDLVLPRLSIYVNKVWFVTAILICRSEDREKAVKLLGKKIVTTCWDGQMLIHWQRI